MMHYFVGSTYYHTMYIHYKYTLNVFTKLEYGISLDRVYALHNTGLHFLNLAKSKPNILKTLQKLWDPTVKSEMLRFGSLRVQM